jgi:septal ring factor EnvC (AmiA/AmiB activator)
MRGPCRRALSIGLLIPLFCCWLTVDAEGKKKKDSGDSISQKIEQEQKALETVRTEIEERRKKAEEAGRAKDSILQTIQELDHKLVTSRHDRQEVLKRIAEKDDEIAQLDLDIVHLTKQVHRFRQSVVSRLRRQYIESRTGPVQTLLASEGYTDFLRRLDYLSSMAKWEYDLMARYTQESADLIEKEHQRTEARASLVSYRIQTERAMVVIQSAKGEKRQVLVRVSREKVSHDRAVGELERSVERLDGLLKELFERRKAAALVTIPKTLPTLKVPTGRLPWPTEGDVVSHFGRQKHPTFDTFVQRKGIEIRAKEGSPIRAVMPGSVVYADWLKGYGLVAIVDHGKWFSLYAHASKLLVKTGEVVAVGQELGETGDTGMTGESSLYFELREGAIAVDPLVWLAKK